MTVLRFTQPPTRKVELVRNPDGSWFATYAGDPWEEGWRTESGSLALVRAALSFDLTRGLPVVKRLPDPKPGRRAA
ncbi:hypothetical protein [Alteraurantiacibacter buctensis]|uniref:Uncharacterized protein n=1 Tax=Alteraurantiacibacter buctensis TaxID=1503981 RepID=A0A844YXU0_9SPHN|nr:hypothetical protein [Alteraurantiacibacter buctensis]MXO72379.1 hypothetical protein [Alteraurantiacibacter buctensis]